MAALLKGGTSGTSQRKNNDSEKNVKNAIFSYMVKMFYLLRVPTISSVEAGSPVSLCRTLFSSRRLRARSIKLPRALGRRPMNSRKAPMTTMARTTEIKISMCLFLVCAAKV